MVEISTLGDFARNYIDAALEQRNLLAAKVGGRAVDALSDGICYQIAIAATRDLTVEDMARLIASAPELLNMQFGGNTNLGVSPSIGRIFASKLQETLERDMKHEWRSVPIPDFEG